MPQHHFDVVLVLAALAAWGVPIVVPVPVSFNLIATTVVILYVGCHRSLRLRDKVASPPDEQDTISQEDAMKFPLIGSAVLFGLFLVLKFFDKSMVNLLLAVYFSALGAVSLQALIVPLTVPLQTKNDRAISLPWLGRVTLWELLCWAIGVAVAGVYFKTKHWTLNNLLGFSFSVHGIEKLSLGSFKVAAILLSGLFFYDIFWVFGTDKLLTGDSVMVTVAKSLDAPIKLLFPKVAAAVGAAAAAAGEAAAEVVAVKPEFSMLGLGDIVIPGTLLALLLRFDAESANAEPTEGANARFSKPFFHVCLLGYVLGLATTLIVMEKFKAAQPALLYLVPSCLGSALLVGAYRRNFGALFAYDEEQHDAKAAAATEEAEAAAAAAAGTSAPDKKHD